MKVVLTQNGLRKALSERPTGMLDDDWLELDEKALSAIQLMPSKEVLREVANEKTTKSL